MGLLTKKRKVKSNHRKQRFTKFVRNSIKNNVVLSIMKGGGRKSRLRKETAKAEKVAAKAAAKAAAEAAAEPKKSSAATENPDKSASAKVIVKNLNAVNSVNAVKNQNPNAAPATPEKPVDPTTAPEKPVVPIAPEKPIDPTTALKKPDNAAKEVSSEKPGEPPKKLTRSNLQNLSKKHNNGKTKELTAQQKETEARIAAITTQRNTASATHGVLRNIAGSNQAISNAVASLKAPSMVNKLGRLDTKSFATTIGHTLETQAFSDNVKHLIIDRNKTRQKLESLPTVESLTNKKDSKHARVNAEINKLEELHRKARETQNRNPGIFGKLFKKVIGGLSSPQTYQARIARLRDKHTKIDEKHTLKVDELKQNEKSLQNKLTKHNEKLDMTVEKGLTQKLINAEAKVAGLDTELQNVTRLANEQKKTTELEVAQRLLGTTKTGILHPTAKDFFNELKTTNNQGTQVTNTSGISNLFEPKPEPKPKT